jgi:TPP-dependent pyruvate/acetoin dehydrogenase alpha subunit
MNIMKYQKDFLLQLYRTMLRIRRFEEKAIEMKARQTIPGIIHLYIGEEAIATGVCAALRKDDYIFSTHRGHGHCIAKGGDIGRMMAELFGREAGYCRGKGGSMHIADIDLGILGANAVVAAGLPISGGAGLSIKMRGTDQVVVCFFGDAATNNGAFHEALNLSSVWKLPVIFVCENNLYGISVAQSRSTPIRDLYLRKDSYGMPGFMADGNDVLKVYETVNEALERARKGGGPTLIEYKTYRWRGHYEGEADRTYYYRSKKEEEEWKEKCPIKRFRQLLSETEVADKETLDRIDSETQQELENAVEFAKNCPWPAPEDALRDVYKES